MTDETRAKALKRERISHERRLAAAKEGGDKELAAALGKRIAAIDAALEPKAAAKKTTK